MTQTTVNRQTNLQKLRDGSGPNHRAHLTKKWTATVFFSMNRNNTIVIKIVKNP
jgi:hypothetical protein